MSEIDGYFSRNTITADFFSLITGDLIGEGSSRAVYECKLDPDIVIKFEHRAGSFQNVAEWQVWDRVGCVLEIKDWFCPCVAISACGSILIQKRAQNIREKELPKRVPAFFTDMKMENWGLYKGKPVIRDYGTHLLLENGMTKRMITPHWTIK